MQFFLTSLFNSMKQLISIVMTFNENNIVMYNLNFQIPGTMDKLTFILKVAEYSTPNTQS